MAQSDILITAQSLLDIYNNEQGSTQNKSLLVVDLRDRAAWLQGHIPGSVHLDVAKLRARPDAGHPPPLPILIEHFSAVGIGDDTRVVALDDLAGKAACRLIWSLHLLGHRRCSWFSGGIGAWLAQGGELVDTSSEPAAAALQQQPDAALDTTMQQLIDRLGTVQVWDCRSREEYEGKLAHARRAGHVPGAFHYEWSDLLHPDGEVREESEVLEELQSAGLNPTEPVITYCQLHARSSVVYVVGQALGLDIHAYSGSWAEWGNADHTPIEGNSE